PLGCTFPACRRLPGGAPVHAGKLSAMTFARAPGTGRWSRRLPSTTKAGAAVATTTRPDPKKTDRYGIERVTDDDPGFVDKLRMKHGWFDHIMRMQERYTEQGGNHFAAGVTYFSVLSVFPVLMLAFAILGLVLRGNEDLLTQLQDQITEAVEGDLGNTVNDILESAISQAGGVFTIGFVTALWSGLSWMGNLRMGVTALWRRPIIADNFALGKLRDFIRLLGMMV